MLPPHQHLRINLTEMKSQIIKKLGPERSKLYLYYFSRLLSLKVTKSEFDRLCLQLVGRDNIRLHNQFVLSVLKNACNQKVPPPVHEKVVLKSKGAAVQKESPFEGCPSGPQSSLSHTNKPLIFPNGDMLPLSPRKARSGIRGRKAGDRLAHLAPDGKINLGSQQSRTIHDNDFNAVMVNGHLTPISTQRQEVLCHIPSKLSEVKTVVENKNEVPIRSLIRAPLGIPLCPSSVGAARRVKPSFKYSQFAGNEAVLETNTLRERMELIAASQGLEEGVSMDCANLLSSALEAYLKGLIRSCIELVGARSGYEPVKNIAACGKLFNGVRPKETMLKQRSLCPISLLDFRVAMELNPQQLGEDWPLLLEKICTQAFEE